MGLGEILPLKSLEGCPAPSDPTQINITDAVAASSTAPLSLTAVLLLGNPVINKSKSMLKSTEMIEEVETFTDRQLILKEGKESSGT